jgi:hypothetical protein
MDLLRGSPGASAAYSKRFALFGRGVVELRIRSRQIWQQVLVAKPARLVKSRRTHRSRGA